MAAPSPDNGFAAPAAKRLRLGRSARLAQSREFSRVRQAGERLVQGCLIANWRALPAGSPVRLGVVTSKRIGGAVERGRARRLLRESFRLHQHDLAAPVDMVLVARNSIVGKSFAGVEKDYLAALKKAGLMK
jgi:ribonuclease P protein component